MATTVHLPAGYYFVVSEQTFDLYYKNPENKTATPLGYISSVDRLINRVIQHNLSIRDYDTDLMGFLEKWQRMQQKLVDVLKIYGFAEEAKNKYNNTLLKLSE